MKQHPVRTAFEHIDDRASSEFRETLRAQLLADLAVPMSKDNHPTEETIVTYANNHSTSARSRRVAIGAAAALVIAVGVATFLINRNTTDNGSLPADAPTTTVFMMCSPSGRDDR